jgi:tocopherol O-methyltransferase
LQLVKLCGWRGFRFAKQLRLMQAAFNNNMIKYGVFIVRKPIA